MRLAPHRAPPLTGATIATRTYDTLQAQNPPKPGSALQYSNTATRCGRAAEELPCLPDTAAGWGWGTSDTSHLGRGWAGAKDAMVRANTAVLSVRRAHGT